MGWLYMLVCFCDFVAFPVLWAVFQGFIRLHETGAMQVTQWNPITMQGAGLFHLAMGAILGISAFGRTQEKLGGVATVPTPSSVPAMPAAAPMPTPMPVARPTPVTTPVAPAPVATSPLNSKSAIPTMSQPEL
jgi:hypothetical protein